LERFQEHVARLYEQDAPPEEIWQRIGQYVQRWKRWVVSGIEVSGSFEWRVVGPDAYVPRILLPVES
jgi:hypothetical protein